MRSESSLAPKVALFCQTSLCGLIVGSTVYFTFRHPHLGFGEFAFVVSLSFVPVLSLVLLMLRKRAGWVLSVCLHSILAISSAVLYARKLIEDEQPGVDGADQIDSLLIHGCIPLFCAFTIFLLSRPVAHRYFGFSGPHTAQLSTEAGIHP
jgi:hypothetical protein